MQPGKVKESVLKRSVLRPIENAGSEREAVLAAGGLDGKSGTHESSICVKVIPVEGWTLAARRAVYDSVNALAAAGARPLALAVTVLMPEETEEPRLKGLMQELGQLCAREGLTLSAGHTAVSPLVDTLLLTVTGIGLTDCEADPPVSFSIRSMGRTGTGGRNQADQAAHMDLLMIGHAGREGAALLASCRREDLLKRYAASFLEPALHFYDRAGLTGLIRILRQHGMAAGKAVREGGVFAALWELAAFLGTGLSVDIRKIPIRQHTIEICEYFNLNPYQLLSGGCLLAVCPDGEAALAFLEESAEATAIMSDQGITAGVIGRTRPGNDRLVSYDTETRYLEPARMDEIYKVLWKR